MSDDLILNLDGLPFPTPEWADRMRRLLERETGRAYVIEIIPGGFGLRRVEAVRSVPLQAVPVRAEPSWPTHTFRPAVIRANLFRMPLLLLGIALALGYGTWLLCPCDQAALVWGLSAPRPLWRAGDRAPVGEPGQPTWGAAVRAVYPKAPVGDPQASAEEGILSFFIPYLKAKKSDLVE